MFITSRESAIVPNPFHRFQALYRSHFRVPGKLGRKFSRSESRSSEFRCAEHISTPKVPRSRRIFGFYRVLYLFSGKWLGRSCRSSLYIVFLAGKDTTQCGVYTVGSNVTPIA